MIEKKRKEEKKKINGKFSTNRVFAYRENIFVPANFLHTAGIKISYYRNARVYTYIYIREVETTWCIYSEMIRI